MVLIILDNKYKYKLIFVYYSYLGSYTYISLDILTVIFVWMCENVL